MDNLQIDIILAIFSFPSQPSSVTAIDVQGIASAIDVGSPSSSSNTDVWEIPRHNLTVGDLKESGRFSEMCFGKVVLKNSHQVAVLVKRAKGKKQHVMKLAKAINIGETYGRNAVSICHQTVAGVQWQHYGA